MRRSNALRRDPAHPGALHFRIHLWDGVKPERALQAAPLYGPSAPGIAHEFAYTPEYLEKARETLLGTLQRLAEEARQ